MISVSVCFSIPISEVKLVRGSWECFQDTNRTSAECSPTIYCKNVPCWKEGEVSAMHVAEVAGLKVNGLHHGRSSPCLVDVCALAGWTGRGRLGERSRVQDPLRPSVHRRLGRTTHWVIRDQYNLEIHLGGSGLEAILTKLKSA